MNKVTKILAILILLLNAFTNLVAVNKIRLNISQLNNERTTLEVQSDAEGLLRNSKLASALGGLEFGIAFWVVLSIISSFFMITNKKVGWYIAGVFVLVNSLGIIFLHAPKNLAGWSNLILLLFLGFLLLDSYKKVFARNKKP